MPRKDNFAALSLVEQTSRMFLQKYVFKHKYGPSELFHLVASADLLEDPTRHTDLGILKIVQSSFSPNSLKKAEVGIS